jgi:hypothetical protein
MFRAYAMDSEAVAIYLVDRIVEAAKRARVV